ncbi:MAG: radical SAM family heme chaperone HemW [Phycisphaerae bacterium]|nr:radical SAM family heme chaperone HemW [Phycisphaerae bacterium]
MSNNSNSKFVSENIGLYVHIPFCRTKCRYCNFYSVPITEYDSAAVISAMIAELKRYEPDKNTKTIYIGGGSPSCLPQKLLLQLIYEVTQHAPSAEEFTVEVNPGQVDETLLNQLRKAGVNRLSIGAQSFIQQELALLGRTHNVDSIYDSVRLGRAAGFDNISLDLIFAVPCSSLDSWKQNLRRAVELQPKHISAYALTWEDNTPLGRALAAGEIQQVDEDTDREMYELTIDELGKAGLCQYEISNFAKKDFQCRHNLNYWANGSYIGIGPAAASYINGQRCTNSADIGRYVEAIESGTSPAAETETLNSLERACETAVLNLRRRRGIDLAEFKTRTGFDAAELFAEPIRMYQQQGLINAEDGHVFLTRKALAIADSILCDFAAV